jgi:hypothetical protein
MVEVGVGIERMGTILSRGQSSREDESVSLTRHDENGARGRGRWGRG